MASVRWPNGSTRAWRNLRAEVIERDGHRCTHHDGRGRCTATHTLEVHHKRGGSKLLARKGDLATICRFHHVPPSRSERPRRARRARTVSYA